MRAEARSTDDSPAPAAQGPFRYDVFLSHSHQDQQAVRELADKLERRGLTPFVDARELIPGEAWQPALEAGLAASRTCAVFIGPAGLGAWHREEMLAAVDRRVQDESGAFRVIPVLLPGAQRGRRSGLPSFLSATTWVVFEHSLDEEEPLRRLVAGVRGVAPGSGIERAPLHGQCPYRGLRSFGIEDAPFFAGREALVEWLVDALRPRPEQQAPEPRFLAIVGASGSGKSSLARAGLLASLKAGALDGAERWPIGVLRPGSAPLENLALALGQSLSISGGPAAIAALPQELRRQKTLLHVTAALALTGSPERRFVLFVDQFEELFTECADEEERRAFVECLSHAARAPRGQTLVVLAMRADFYGHCARYDGLAALVSERQMLVGAMSEDELRRAIVRPAQLTGCELERALVDTLVDEVRGQPGALPLLQDALQQLWERRKGQTLGFDAYREIGRLSGALGRRADAVVARFDADEQQLCRRIFLRLTKPGEGTGDSKRRVPLRALTGASEQRAQLEKVVKQLADAALVVTDAKPSGGDAFIEVVHEALLRSWPALRKWIDADRTGLALHRALSEAAEQWEQQQRDPSYLFSGTRLAVTREWAAQHAGDLNEAEHEFLVLSQIEHGTRFERLPHSATLQAAERLLAPYLGSGDPLQRAKGATMLPLLAPPGGEEAVRMRLFAIAATDPKESVRRRAAEVLCQSGQMRWFLGEVAAGRVPDGGKLFHLQLAAAQCCQLQDAGPKVLETLRALAAKQIQSLESGLRVWTHLGELTAVFALVYFAVYLAEALVGNLLFGLIGTIANTFWHAPVSLRTTGALTSAAAATMLRYYVLRMKVERKAVRADAALWVSAITLALVWFASLLDITVSVTSQGPAAFGSVIVAFSAAMISNAAPIMILTLRLIEPIERPLRRWYTFGMGAAAGVMASVMYLVGMAGMDGKLQLQTMADVLGTALGVVASALTIGATVLAATLASRAAQRAVAAPSELPTNLFD